MRDFKERYGLTAAGMQRFWNLYLDGADGFQPDASPLRADDLAGLPPTFVLTAEFDVLRDEGEAYARASCARRGSTSRTAATTAPSTASGAGWPATAETRAAIDEVGAALRRELALSDAAADRRRRRHAGGPGRG